MSTTGYVYNYREHDTILYSRDHGHYAETWVSEGGWTPIGSIAGEHHATTRANARRAVKAYHGEDWDIVEYVGWTPYVRRADGTSRRSRKYLVGRVD